MANQIVDKATSTQPDETLTATKLSAEQRNSARVAMIKKGCSLNTNKLKFSTLRQLQHNLTNNLGLDAKYIFYLGIENLRACLYPTLEIQTKYLTDHQPPIEIKGLQNTQLYDLFQMDQYKLLACLPPKAGTTNWQRYFAALLDPNREPEDFDDESNEIYYATPRVLSTYRGPKRKKVNFTTTEGLTKLYKNYTKFINVRHPLARLLSGKSLIFEQNVKF